jgi:hypothetical protein
MMGEFVEKVSFLISDDRQRYVLAQLRSFRGDDLEGILGELDTIIGLDYADSVTGLSGRGPARSRFELSTDDARRLRLNIKHEVIREYRNVDAEKAVRVYEPLFDIVFSHLSAPSKHPVPIFTTNYDPAIEEFCNRRYEGYALQDGFEYDRADRHNYWSRSVFDRFEPETGKRNLALFKLHGSVDWVRVKASQKIRRGQAMFDVMDSDAYENILIYPATRKIATDDPFYTGYEYFERCCERATVCVAIGYSFRDYDALTRLRGAVSANDDLILILVDPRAEEVLKTIPIPEERKVPLNVRFGGLPEQLAMLSELLESAMARS